MTALDRARRITAQLLAFTEDLPIAAAFDYTRPFAARIVLHSGRVIIVTGYLAEEIRKGFD